MSEVRCCQCGKAIVKEDDITMKNVSVGWFNSVRVPFHLGCWKKYHKIKIRKEAMQYGALAVIAFLMVGAYLFTSLAQFLVLS